MQCVSRLSFEAIVTEKEDTVHVFGRTVHLNFHTYIPLLKHCAQYRDLDVGSKVHRHIVTSGHDRDMFLSNLLLEMYGKCGRVDEARQVFDKMGARNVYTWSIIISAYAHNGHYLNSFKLFRLMDLEGTPPNSFTLSTLVGACAGLGDFSLARRIHTRVQASGYGAHVFLGTALINMYTKCGCSTEARLVFDGMHEKTVVSWNAVISAAVQFGQADEAGQLLRGMDLEGMQPDQFTLTTVLPACSNLTECKFYHERIRSCGYDSMLTVQNALIDCYGKCGSVEDARAVFDEVRRKDVITWTAMISSYVENGDGREAIQLYELMEQAGQSEPNLCTFTAVVDACSLFNALDEGRVVHSRIVSRGIVSVELGAAVVNMYVKCGRLPEAESVLMSVCVRSVSAWNFVISAGSQQRLVSRTFQLFGQMALEGTKADALTFAAVLGVCSEPSLLAKGKALQLLVSETGLDSESSVGTALINMHARCTGLDDAWKAFERITRKTVLVWSALITVYAQAEQSWRTLQLYEEMIMEGVKPDMHTFATVLGACARLGSLREGKSVHTQMLLSIGLETDVVLGTSLLDMYAKCGRLSTASHVFELMPERNILTWTALIAGFAQHGHGTQALDHFHWMISEGFQPDYVTFTIILQGCNHGGLLAEGHICILLMRESYEISPAFEHYDCMVDLLARAGRLRDAESLILDMPFHPNDAPWRSLLGGCRIHADLNVAKRAAERVFHLSLPGTRTVPERLLPVAPPGETECSSYVVLSNIYSDDSASG